MSSTSAASLHYCNQLALEKGLDPVGHAPAFTDTLVIEVPLPWKPDIYTTAGAVPQQVIDLFNLWRERYLAGLGYPHALLMIAPDRQHTQPGLRRVMYYDRPAAHFAAYRKVEYAVPEAHFGALIWALAEAHQQRHHFEPYRQPEHDHIRDLFVCTHGSIDIACAKFGHPLYTYLNRHHTQPHTRVWRVSHFGGHIFAPTLIDMPTGHYWAYVDRTQADQIIARTGEVAPLYRHYRGWAGLDSPFLQAADRELWQRCGWDWFSYAKSGSFHTANDAASNRVSITYTPPGQAARHYTANVYLHQHIITPHSSASPDTFSFAQYKVAESHE